MNEALQRAQQLMAQWDDELRRELPDGADIFDAHTHLGTDIDGIVGAAASSTLASKESEERAEDGRESRPAPGCTTCT